MPIDYWVNFLTIIVLLALLVAIIYLIVFLHRANRVMGRLDNLSSSIRGFISEIVPAVVNIGAVVAAVEGVLKKLVEHHTKQIKK